MDPLVIEKFMRWGAIMADRKRVGVTVATFVLLGAIGGWAQNGKTTGNTAQAVLHIQAVVMPTVLSTPANEGSSEGTSVSYHLPVITLKQESTVEELPLPETVYQLPCVGLACQGTVRTTTVVAR